MKHTAKEDMFLDRNGNVTTDESRGEILLARAGRPIAPALIARHGLESQLGGKKRSGGAPKNKSETPPENKSESSDEVSLDDLRKLKRSELDEMAEDLGLDPSEFANIDEVSEAIYNHES